MLVSSSAYTGIFTTVQTYVQWQYTVAVHLQAIYYSYINAELGHVLIVHDKQQCLPIGISDNWIHVPIRQQNIASSIYPHTLSPTLFQQSTQVVAYKHQYASRRKVHIPIWSVILENICITQNLTKGGDRERIRRNLQQVVVPSHLEKKMQIHTPLFWSSSRYQYQCSST